MCNETTRFTIDSIKHSFNIQSKGDLTKYSEREFYYEVSIFLNVSKETLEKDKVECMYNIFVNIDMFDSHDKGYRVEISAQAYKLTKKIENVSNIDIAEYITNVIYSSDQYKLIHEHYCNCRDIIRSKLIEQLDINDQI